MSPVPADFQASLAAIDMATTKLGGNVTTMSAAVDSASVRFDALKDSIKTSMTPDEVAAVKASIDAETTRLDTASTGLDVIATALNGIGADPAVPVPPIPEIPVLDPNDPNDPNA